MRLVLVLMISFWLPDSLVSARSDLVTEFNAGYRAYNAAHSEGRYADAVPYAEEVLELGQQLMADRPEQLAILTFNLGDTYQLVGRIDDAVSTLELAVTRYQTAFGVNSLDVADPLVALGEALVQRAGNAPPGGATAPMREAMEAFERVYVIYSANFEPKDPQLALVSVRLGEIEHALGKTSASIERFEAVIDLTRDAGSKYAAQHLQALTRLAAIAEDGKNNDEAVAYLLQAMEVLEALDDPPHEALISVHEHLAKILHVQGDHDAATPHVRTIALLDPRGTGSDPRSIYRPIHIFPKWAQMREASGVAVVSFDVDERGFVRNPQVLAAEPSGLFEESALDAVSKYRYAPKVIEGQFAVAKGVTVKLIWEIYGKGYPRLDWETSAEILSTARKVGVRVLR